ncbi:receptor-like protein 12 [Tanacetum coccineum]
MLLAWFYDDRRTSSLNAPKLYGVLQTAAVNSTKSRYSCTGTIKGFEDGASQILDIYTSLISQVIVLSSGVINQKQSVHSKQLQNPAAPQLQSFEKYSFIGNKGLCGPPLSRTCGSPEMLTPKDETSSDGNDWQTFFYGMGAGAGSLAVAAVLYIYKANTSSTTRQTRSV